ENKRSKPPQEEALAAERFSKKKFTKKGTKPQPILSVVRHVQRIRACQCSKWYPMPRLPRQVQVEHAEERGCQCRARFVVCRRSCYSTRFQSMAPGFRLYVA